MHKGKEGKGKDGKGYDGKGYDGKGYDGKGYDGKGYDGKGYDGKGYDGKGHGGKGKEGAACSGQGYGDGLVVVCQHHLDERSSKTQSTSTNSFKVWTARVIPKGWTRTRFFYFSGVYFILIVIVGLFTSVPCRPIPDLSGVFDFAVCRRRIFPKSSRSLRVSKNVLPGILAWSR